MGKVASRKAADIAIKPGRDMIKLMKDCDQLVSKRPVKKPWDHEADHVKDTPPLMGYLGHYTAKSSATAPDSLDKIAFRKSQGVDFGKQPMCCATAGGVNADK